MPRPSRKTRLRQAAKLRIAQAEYDLGVARHVVWHIDQLGSGPLPRGLSLIADKWGIK